MLGSLNKRLNLRWHLNGVGTGGGLFGKRPCYADFTALAQQSAMFFDKASGLRLFLRLRQPLQDVIGFIA